MEETSEVTVRYTDKATGRCLSQKFVLSQDTVEQLYDEIAAYKGGKVDVDTTIFNILTACTYLSKAEGFVGTPCFDIELPEDIVQRANGIS